MSVTWVVPAVVQAARWYCLFSDLPIGAVLRWCNSGGVAATPCGQLFGEEQFGADRHAIAIRRLRNYFAAHGFTPAARFVCAQVFASALLSSSDERHAAECAHLSSGDYS